MQRIATGRNKPQQAATSRNGRNRPQHLELRRRAAAAGLDVRAEPRPAIIVIIIIIYNKFYYIYYIIQRR